MNLHELVSDVTDLAAPESMDKLKVYLDQLRMDDDDFMELLVERVHGMPITWTQPWYQKINSLTRPLEQDKLREQFRIDSFSNQECEQLVQNWKMFRKEFSLPNTPICIARWKNRKNTRNPCAREEQTRQFVMAYLAKGLERNLYQVNQFFISHYGAPVKGPYSSLEVKIMQICFYHSPEKGVMNASDILSREPRGIRKKLQLLFKDVQEKKQLKWTLPVATKLVKSLMKHSFKPFKKLKYSRFDTTVWLNVQEDMGQQYIALQRFWYTFLHVQLFVKYDVKLKRVRRKVLKFLKNSSYEVWTDIRWKDVLSVFPDGFTHGFLYCTIQPLVAGYPNYRRAPINKLIECCWDKMKKASRRGRRLRTLAFNDSGDLEIIKYEEKMP